MNSTYDTYACFQSRVGSIPWVQSRWVQFRLGSIPFGFNPDGTHKQDELSVELSRQAGEKCDTVRCVTKL